MKFLRVWLLVLLAVVLPVRGALAAAMLCAPAGVSLHGGAVVANQVTGHGHHADAPHHAGHDHHRVAHDHAGADHHQHGIPGGDQGGHDRCNTCSASCSSPTLPSASAGIDEPLPMTAASFPELAAPAPTFLSDGQERPPRTF